MRTKVEPERFEGKSPIEQGFTMMRIDRQRSFDRLEGSCGLEGIACAFRSFELRGCEIVEQVGSRRRLTVDGIRQNANRVVWLAKEKVDAACFRAVRRGRREGS